MTNRKSSILGISIHAMVVPTKRAAEVVNAVAVADLAAAVVVAEDHAMSLAADAVNHHLVVVAADRETILVVIVKNHHPAVVADLATNPVVIVKKYHPAVVVVVGADPVVAVMHPAVIVMNPAVIVADRVMTLAVEAAGAVEIGIAMTNRSPLKPIPRGVVEIAMTGIAMTEIVTRNLVAVVDVVAGVTAMMMASIPKMAHSPEIADAAVSIKEFLLGRMRSRA